MIQAFYQTKPVKDTPYRELVFEHDEEIWHVLLLGGTMWGAKGRSRLADVTAKDFEEGKAIYDRMFNELLDSGWRPYTPYETWERG